MEGLDSILVEEAVGNSLERVVTYLNQNKLDDSRKGGVIRVIVFDSTPGNKNPGIEVYHEGFGDIPTGQRWRYELHSAEKANRIIERWRAGHQDQSSWVTRNISLPSHTVKQYGGGIHCIPIKLLDPSHPYKDTAIAFSGLSQEADEAVCMLTALECGWIVPTKEIIGVSGNKIAENLIKAYLAEKGEPS